MEVKSKNNIAYTLIWCLIVSASFSLYSSTFYPLLNADDALNILMAQHYQWPRDVYCWGQDRGGTLIPLIAHGLIRLLHIKAIHAVSLSNYLILILGYFGFASLLKSRTNKLIFAVLWFLPFQRFIDLVRFPIGIEYSCVGCAIFLISYIRNNRNSHSLLWHLAHIALMISALCSMWVSDLSFINIVAMLVVLILNIILNRKSSSVQGMSILYFFIGLFIVSYLIWYAKSNAIHKVQAYVELNHLTQFRQAIQMVLQKNLELLTFRTHETLVSIAAILYLLLLLFFILSVFIKKKRTQLLRNVWVQFILLDMLAVLLVLFTASWVLKNDMGRWYFVGTYISISMLLMLFLENLKVDENARAFKRSILFAALLGAASTFHNLKYINPKSLTPMSIHMEEFTQLGKCGIIADFWSSYICSITDPDLVAATPNDAGAARNQALVDTVLARKNLYVIRDNWLPNFPDTLFQYGYTLAKDGHAFRLGNCDICKYKKTKVHRVFLPKQMHHPNATLVFDSISHQSLLRMKSDTASNTNKYLVFGPYIPIGIGSFDVVFYVKKENKSAQGLIATFDVSYDFGKEILINRNVYANDLSGSDMDTFKLEFSTKKRLQELEFRVVQRGAANVLFEKIELLEK